MRTFSRYSYAHFFRLFSLSLFAFITTLIVARFKDITRFGALSHNLRDTLRFTVYQIPTILWIAIPISALITSLLFFRHLSRSGELTALRASGLSLPRILTPTLTQALALALLSFAILADLAPYCRREAKLLVYNTTTQNPLLLLGQHKVNSAYIELDMESAREAKNLLLIAAGKNLSLLSAEKLSVQKEMLTGKNVAILSYLPEGIAIENQAAMTTKAPHLSKRIQKNSPKKDSASMSFRELGFEEELKKRLSLAFTPLTLALLGASHGIETGRSPSKWPLFIAILLTPTLFFLPLFSHIPILFASLYRLRKISRGTA